MKGSNTIQFNEATIIAAVQEYLDKRYTPNIQVQSVKATSSGAGYATQGMFAVEVTEAPEPLRPGTAG